MSLPKKSAFKCQVRPAEAEDEAAWRYLWQAYCDFYSVEPQAEATDVLWRRILDRRSPVNALIAETPPNKDGEIETLGFANYVLHPYTWGTDLICYLEDLFVAEQARGQGAGSALIDSLVRMAKLNGWPRVYWHTHEQNEVARSLYDRFTPVDPFVRYLITTR